VTTLGSLNALRILACLGVLLAHGALEWVPGLGQSGRALGSGRAGVCLFFTLSGYLITRILLAERAAIEAGRSRTIAAAMRFLARRAARVMPAYFALLIAVQLVLEPVHWSAWVYLYNVVDVATGIPQRVSPALSHVWSLCVEEHYYLVWPWLALALPRRGSLIALAVAVPAAIIAAELHYAGRDALAPDYFGTPANLLPLGVGSALAYTDALVARSAVLRRLLFIAPFIGLAGAAEWAGEDLRALACRTVFAAGLLGGALAWEASPCAEGSTVARLRRALSTPRVNAIAFATYGLYLYHFPIYWWCYRDFALGDASVPDAMRPPAEIVAMADLALLLVTWISYLGERWVRDRVHRALRTSPSEPARPLAA
jgi:peptidoglycan/LPS O-acetylase OafA/YrhL